MAASELALLAGATRALAEVSTAKDAWELARTAEAARRYAQLKDMGTEAVNYATGIKAKAMVLLADFIDAGQADGTVATRGRPDNCSAEEQLSVPEVLGTEDSQQARRAVYEARRLRDALAGADVDDLVARANEAGDDLGIRGLRAAAAAEAGPAPVAEPVPPAAGRYSCLVIDPPWQYDNTATRGAAEDHYPTMGLDELAALQPPSADNAHLYLWVTNGFLRQGFDLIEAWGFTYKVCLTWVKPQIGMGNWFRNSTEHVLFGVKGQLPTRRNDVPTWFQANRTRHSAKPESFYDLVESCSPGPYLEMFARRHRPGWSVWGNEA